MANTNISEHPGILQNVLITLKRAIITFAEQYSSTNKCMLHVNSILITVYWYQIRVERTVIKGKSIERT